jgi:hypothetical protein
MPSNFFFQLLSGTDLAQALTTKEAIARKKSAMPPDVSKALARLSSGLYLVTAAHDGARSAMVASWVTQVRAYLVTKAHDSARGAMVASWVTQVHALMPRLRELTLSSRKSVIVCRAGRHSALGWLVGVCRAG